MVEGKARLLRDDYCDGLGDCLPACPAGAITIEEREAEPYDEAAVRQAQQAADEKEELPVLGMWPIQIKLAPIVAPYFQGCDLLVAADCTAFAHGSFREFTSGRTVLIGCTKLDNVDYSEKLAKIIARNNVRSVHIVRMEVPCCGGMVMAVRKALETAGVDIPVQVTVISTRGEVNR
jgi:ferredoxin